MKKRVISLILSLILLITLFPTALAEPATSGVCGDALTWTLDSEGTLTISGKGWMYNHENREDVPWYALRKSIKNIVVNEGLTHIGKYAFANCINLESVTLPKSMYYIYAYAFLGCLSLKDVYISDLTAWCNVTFEWLDRYASNPLYMAKNLYVNGVLMRDLVIPEGTGIIRSTNFAGFCGIDSVTIPSTVYHVHTEAFIGCNNLESFTVSPYNQYFTDIDGVLFSKDETKLIAYPGGRSDDTYAIPEGTVNIGISSFTNCSRLKHIYLNDGLKTIGNWAFTYCSSLEEIVIPDTVTDVGWYVFEECGSLKYAVLSSGMSELQFDTFIRCPLEYIVIPAGIKTIGSSVFTGYVDIGDVYYGGNAVQWAALMANTGYGNDSLENARLHLGTLDPNDHYTATATKPTCTAQGYTTYTCPCGNSYTDDYTDALGHDYGKGGVCTRCGEKNPNYKAKSFSSILLDSIRNIFESLFKWLPFC